MPLINVEVNATRSAAEEPIIWRLGELFHVVTNIRRARVTDSHGFLSVDLEGSTSEVEQAQEYLRGLGILKGADGTSKAPSSAPGPVDPLATTIYVRLSAKTPDQAKAPVLYRAGKEFNVVINIERASFDGTAGWIDVAITGPLNEVQRAIAYLHTTGLQINPRQRSVTDFSNL